MASRIILDPETLLAQAGEMQSLTAEYRFESLCICTKRQILFCQRNVPGVGGITIRWKYTRTAEA